MASVNGIKMSGIHSARMVARSWAQHGPVVVRDDDGNVVEVGPGPGLPPNHHLHNQYIEDQHA